MRESGILGLLIVAVVIGICVAVWRTVEVIGGATMAVIVTVAVVFAGLSALVASLSLVIKAWRRPVETPPVVEHHYHEGTRVERHTIDGRATPVLPGQYNTPQLPPGTQISGVFPSMLYGMLSSGYQAGNNAAADRAGSPGRRPTMPYMPDDDTSPPDEYS